MPTTVDFGPVKPSVQPYQGGYSVPAALKQVERQGPDSQPELTWQGYLLMVPFLSELELDQALATLPAGDYSTDRQEALHHAVQLSRKAAYPPIEDYIDGVVKGDDAQVAAYKAKCLEVKKHHPLPVA
jgi:hypothetical protein